MIAGVTTGAAISMRQSTVPHQAPIVDRIGHFRCERRGVECGNGKDMGR